MAKKEKDVNALFYGVLHLGQRDYWRYMAAPRGRMGKALSILSEMSPERIVDLGCGDGSLLSIVAQRFPKARLAGVDLSSVQIESNRRESPAVDWHVMDLDSSESLPSGVRGVFDAVVSLEVIEHVAHPANLLSHAFVLSKTGGRLILSTQSGPVGETEKRVGHKRHFTADEMTGLLKSTGWRPLRVWNSGWPFHDLSKWVANLSPNRSMRHFGEGAYTWPQKLICASLRGIFRLNSSSMGAQLFAVAEKP